MRLRDLTTLSFAGLNRNKARSTLSILGVVIGISSIIIIASLSEGAQQLIVGQLSGFGSKTILVGAGREPKGPSDIFEFLTDSLKTREVEALRDKENVPELTLLSPAIFQPTSADYFGETTRGTLLGASEAIFPIFKIYPVAGRVFTEDEVGSEASVVIIGSEIKKKLFGSSDALDEKIKVKDRTFKVIGVFPPIGNITIFNADQFIVIPYTTVQDYLLGAKHYNRIIVQAESEAAVPNAVLNIKRTLRNLHNITDPAKDDFFIDTEASAASRVGLITNIFGSLLLAIGAISLLVGGVGIMNIMLISVTERTKEIGLEKALGAKSGDIGRLFLFEAIILTMTGGMLGVTLGGALSYAASLFLSSSLNLQWQFIFPFSAIVYGLTISIFTGLIFGIYPALRAAKKDPVEALRHE